MLSSSITRPKSMLLRRPGLSRPTYPPFPTQSARVRGAAKKVVNLGEFKPLQNPNFVKLRRGRVGVSHVNEIGSDGGGCRRGGGGEYHVFVGPIFAGKTTTLLRRMQAESNNGSGAKVDKDVRYGLDSIVTHDGVRLPCCPLGELSTFKHELGWDAYEKAPFMLCMTINKAVVLDVIGIAKAQFFEDLYDFCRHSADRDGETIIVAGLHWDYLRKSFGSVLDIIPLADSVTKLTSRSRCELCGKPALFTLRKNK